MEKRANPIRWIMILGAIALIGVLAYSSMQQTHHKFEVCMSFNGATHCATATGANSSQAVRSAQEIDCQLLANGRDENMVCLDRTPTSVREVK